jgi:hypothetical protein
LALLLGAITHAITHWAGVDRGFWFGAAMIEQRRSLLAGLNW